jgi:GTP1/Obg family GTP-binding protein
MRIPSRFLATTICAALSIGGTPLAFAQSNPSEILRSAPSYSDAELKSFAVAALEVQRINDAYLPKLKTASTPEEQKQVEKVATDEMVKAVEKEGMSVDKYKEIMNHAQSNPEIADKVMKHIKSVQ